MKWIRPSSDDGFGIGREREGGRERREGWMGGWDGWDGSACCGWRRENNSGLLTSFGSVEGGEGGR